MAKKPAAAEKQAAPSKSAIIRAYIHTHPSETPKEIAAGLKAEGQEASAALIAKIKYDKGHKSGSGKKAQGKSTSRSTHVNKAESIRQAFKDLGLKTRSKDIIAHLAGQGIKVSSAQVSTLRAKIRTKVKSKARQSANRANGSAGDSISVSSLLAAKQLADQLGGVEAAKLLLDTLAKLS